MHNKKLLKRLFLICFMLSLCACSRTDIIGNNTPISRDGFYFDTIIRISIYGEKKEVADAALDDCFDIAKELEDTLSAQKENSDISKINSLSPNPVAVNEDTIKVIKKGIEYGEKSQGLFDITMGKVTSMWDFAEGTSIPDTDLLSTATSFVDYKNISIKGSEVALEESNSAIDLGGIAKGYIADKMRESLVSNNIKSAIINLGGNVDILGTKPDNTPFTVGIQDPFEDDGTPILLIAATDKSIVTSGTYQRFMEIDGVKYHHILDKNTGMPIQNGLSSVTIISSSSTDCDALSTTCFLLGQKEGLKLIESIPDTEAIFIKDDKEILYSSGAKEYLVE